MLMRKNTEALAIWLAKNQPEVFEAALRAAQGKKIPAVAGVAGISEMLSSFGTTFGSAVKQVGGFLTSDDGLKTLGTVGGLYLQSQGQKDALKLQMSMVQAGYPPQPIQNVGMNTNYAVPVYSPTGQRLTPTMMQQLMPQGSILSEYLPWGVAFAVALGVFYAVSRDHR